MKIIKTDIGIASRVPLTACMFPGDVGRESRTILDGRHSISQYMKMATKTPSLQGKTKKMIERLTEVQNLI